MRRRQGVPPLLCASVPRPNPHPLLALALEHWCTSSTRIRISTSTTAMARRLSLLALLWAAALGVQSLEDGLALLPPAGWNT